MRPLMRWTMGGNVSEAGWECLSESIRITPKVYPEFDYVVCYNNMTPDKLKRLQSFGVDLYEQTEDQIGVSFEFDQSTTESVGNHAWKLCPLRLRPDAHEIWVDNDIILWERIPEIEQFLADGLPIVSQTWSRELYGSFDSDIPKGCSICAGFFGLPPNYPFQQIIDSLLVGKGPLKNYDEQGMIASMIVNNKDGWIGIHPFHLNQLGWWERVKKLPMGGHFIRLNTGTNLSWETYKMTTHPSPKIVNSENWQYKDKHIIEHGPVKNRAFRVVP